MARLPAKISRSAHEIFWPYFCLIGQSRRRALSRLTLSGQLFSGAKRWAPVPPPPRPSSDAVGAGGVPGHPDEEAAVVAVVGGPPILRVGHQRVDVGGECVEVEAVERRRVVEVRAQRIGLRVVLAEDPQVQALGPPVLVRRDAHRLVRGAHDRACRGGRLVAGGDRAVLFVAHVSPDVCCVTVDGAMLRTRMLRRRGGDSRQAGQCPQ